MKVILICQVILAAVCAMVSANGDHSVRVAEQPGQTPVVYNKGQIYPDQAFYQPTTGGNNVNIYPDSGFGGPNGGGGAQSGLNIYPDSGFANPNGGGGVQPISGRPPYPYKQYNNPLARGGK